VIVRAIAAIRRRFRAFIDFAVLILDTDVSNRVSKRLRGAASRKQRGENSVNFSRAPGNMS
jgi:hypothetical protein